MKQVNETLLIANTRCGFVHPVAALAVVLVLLCIGLSVWIKIDFADEANAYDLEYSVDTLCAIDGAFPLGRSPAHDAMFEYEVEVIAENRGENLLHLEIRQWREDYRNVELWMMLKDARLVQVRGHIHFTEDSGTYNGFVHDLSGIVVVSSAMIPLLEVKSSPRLPVVVEYNLSGYQRGTYVALRGKVVL